MKKQDEIVSFLKTYGFVFPNSEIYGGLANAWDYGPLGVLLKNNIKALWWKEFVTKVPNAIGLDSAIISNSTVWKASGHLANFADPLVDCKHCHERFRADKLIEEYKPDSNVTENSPKEILEGILNSIKCPTCGAINWTPIRKFNLMFKTFQGVVEDDKTTLFLRPETCQSIFVDFMHAVRTSRQKLPFSICQIGKAFRNEITPGNFIFRTREFEQMEIEHFCTPDTSMNEFEIWLKKIEHFLFDVIGLNKENIKFKEIPKDELAHYSKRTVDTQYNFPQGFSELWGLAHRGTHDLSAHTATSGKELYIQDPQTQKKIVPEVVEPSVGCERLFYAICCDKFDTEEIKNKDGTEIREVFHLPYALAPYKVAIIPLTKQQNEMATKLYQELVDANISATYDLSSGSIGKKYRRQDANGTPYCITIDFDTAGTNNVTVRERDSMKQTIWKFDTIIDNFIKLERAQKINISHEGK